MRCCFAAASLLSLGVWSAIAAPPAKSAIVDFAQLVEESPAHKKMITELEGYIKDRQAELEKLQEERNKILDKLKAEGEKLKPEEKKALADSADQLDSKSAKILQDGRLHIQRTRTHAKRHIEREIERQVRAYAKEKGIEVVVDGNTPELRIITADPNAEIVDITEAIAKRLEGFKVPAPEVFKPDPNDKEPKPRVVLKTSAGEIVVELDREKAPLTVGNFLKYVDDKHYHGTIFHRVIGEFVIQGGGFTPSLRERDTRDPIPSESKNGLKNEKGTISMARTDDPDSASAQFFINLVDNDKLNYQSAERPGYTVFGRVVKGMDVVEKIGSAKTGTRRGMAEVPLEAIVIESAERVKK